MDVRLIRTVTVEYVANAEMEDSSASTIPCVPSLFERCQHRCGRQLGFEQPWLDDAVATHKR